MPPNQRFERPVQAQPGRPKQRGQRAGADGLLGQLMDRLLGSAMPTEPADPSRDGLVIRRVEPQTSFYVWDESPSDPAPQPRHEPVYSGVDARLMRRTTVPAGRMAAPMSAAVPQQPPPLVPEVLAGPAPDPRPPWQRPFVLPPNVRFTRTPDVALRRREQPEAPPTDEVEPSHLRQAPAPEVEAEAQISAAIRPSASDHWPDAVFWHSMEVWSPQQDEEDRAALHRPGLDSADPAAMDNAHGRDDD